MTVRNSDESAGGESTTRARAVEGQGSTGMISGSSQQGAVQFHLDDSPGNPSPNDGRKGRTRFQLDDTRIWIVTDNSTF